jgi:hypothetical protein
MSSTAARHSGPGGHGSVEADPLRVGRCAVAELGPATAHAWVSACSGLGDEAELA